MKTTHLLLACHTAFALALFGCGAGSDGGGYNTGGNTTTPSTNDQTLINAINTNRSTCLFGSLTTNTDLQDAAIAHALYLISELTGSTSLGHFETNTANYYYTGTTPSNRATYQGYNWSTIGENLTTGVLDPATAVRGLMATPYHTLNLVANHVDIGASHKLAGTPQVGALSAASVIVTGVRQNGTAYTLPAANTVLTYPCNGMSNTARGFTNESPNWQSASGSGSGGQTVVIAAPNGETLTINTAEMTQTVSGNVVTTSLLKQSNDPNTKLTASQAALIPQSTLAANMSYTVVIQGTTTPTAGTAHSFTKNFSFTTGN